MAIKVTEDTLPLKPTKSKHRKIIQKNLDYLCSHTTHLSKLSLILVSLDVMQPELRDQIMAPGQDPLEQYYRMYTHVLKKDELSFQQLLVALRKSGNNHIQKLLHDSYESEVHSAETPEDFPDRRDSFSEGRTRKFKDIRKRDILRFCFWGFGTASLVIISIMLLVRHFQGNNSNNSNNSSILTSPAGFTNTTKKYEATSPSHPSQPSTTEMKPPGDIKPVSPQNYKFLSLQINSPSTQFPQMPDPETRLNLTISATTKYDWRTWKIANPQQMYSLALRGSFNESDVRYLLQYLENVHKFSISHGSYLCAEFTGRTSEAEDGSIVEIHKNIDTIRISVVPECELLYKYLGNSVYFPNLRTVVFERVFISSSNFPFIHDFFSNHQNQLSRLFFLNVTLCDSCEIFKGILFSNLEEAKFIFFDGQSSSAAKTLRNFSEASPYMSKFYSNIACPNVEPKILVQNWRHLRSSAYDFCDE